MAGSSRISDILDHLAWLRDQLAAEVNQGNAYAGALLTYNAASLLQWHFVFPEPHTMGWIKDKDKLAPAAKAIDNFVWAMRNLFQQAKKHYIAGISLGEESVGVIAAIRKQITKVLRELPKLFQLSKPIPRRATECEQSIDPTRMHIQWLKSQPPIDTKTLAVLKEPAVVDSRSAVRCTLAAALWAKGQPQSAYIAGCREVAGALFLEAVEDYSKSFSGKSAKRTAAFCADIAEHLVASTSK